MDRHGKGRGEGFGAGITRPGGLSGGSDASSSRRTNGSVSISAPGLTQTAAPAGGTSKPASVPRTVTAGASFLGAIIRFIPVGCQKSAYVASPQRAWRVVRYSSSSGAIEANDVTPTRPSRRQMHSPDWPMARRCPDKGSTAADNSSRVAMSQVAVEINSSGQSFNFAAKLTGNGGVLAHVVGEHQVLHLRHS